MPEWLAAIPIERGPVLATVYLVAGALVAALAVPVPGIRGRRQVRLLATGVAAVVGALAGLAVAWWVDAQDLFGVTLSAVVRAALAGTGAALGVVVVNLVRTRWWRAAVAVLAAPAVLLAGVLMVNEDIGYYPRLGDLVGDTGITTLSLGGDRGAAPLSSWRPPAGMPATGTVGTVRIPGTVSHFAARRAYVYLPPAARVAHPPRLPVVVALSGEPGGPIDVIDAGHLDQTMNRIAAAHSGVAPVVVVPDQLGAKASNPMCVDSPLGHVATYVSVDVRRWILAHLPVSGAAREWTVAGFSEGGTCAIQLGAHYPAIFGSIVDISGQVRPVNGSVAHTIRTGFGGSVAAYHRESPLGLLAAQRFPRTRALFAAGALDTRYSPMMRRVAAAARAAGMQVSAREVPGGAHNWHMASAGLAWGMDGLVAWWGLPR
jgi:enterochelin esterase-like enzyme